MRTRIIVWLLTGAWMGAMIGQMFDSKSDPALPTLYGAGLGVALATLALMRLVRCDPFRHHFER